MLNTYQVLAKYRAGNVTTVSANVLEDAEQYFRGLCENVNVMRAGICRTDGSIVQTFVREVEVITKPDEDQINSRVNAAYERGFNEGYTNGYAEKLSEVMQSAEDAAVEVYRAGHATGTEEGFISGWNARAPRRQLIKLDEFVFLIFVACVVGALVIGLHLLEPHL